ncbi:cadherin domain-containing protein, partial [Aquabacterium sp.]|uniref:cadherin repeat domain-containing protein n=1 Tax=Aquabacterium sp. TaxID=1872578 RepID=UPI003D6CF772
TLLDYESATSHAITVVATSLDGSSSNQVMTINLADADEFDVGAVSDANAAVNSVAENAANGTVVGITANATDVDGTNNTITYSLSDSAGGRFVINAVTGVVTVANGTLLDYESATSHAITVVATSLDGSSSNQVMTINLTDGNESAVGAVSDTNATANSVAENATNGTVVGITANAIDADGTNNTITYSLSDNAGGRFAINAVTGVVTVANGSLLNYEAATSHAITVVATSADGSSSNQVMTINLVDVNEFAVGAVSDTNAAANSVTENAANGTVVGVTANATDADGTNNTITYSLSDDAGGRFTINASTGVVTVANGGLLDFEASTSHVITVLATSADGSSSSQTFTVSIAPANDNAPVITSGAGLAVAENTTAVGLVTATDADAGSTLTYSIVGGVDAGLFTVNASTGMLSFIAAPDHELPTDANADNVYDVLVQVSDGSFTGQQAMAIVVTNANDAPTRNSSDLQVTTPNTVVNWAPGDLSNAFSDQDGDALQLVVLSPVSHGTLTILADGSVRYEAAAGFSGVDRFSYTVSDGQAQGSVRQVDILVQPPATNGGAGGIPPTNGNPATRPDPTPESPATETPEVPETPQTTPNAPDETVSAPAAPEEGPIEVTPSAGKNASAGRGPGNALSSGATGSNRSLSFDLRLDAVDLDLSMSPGQALFKMLGDMKLGVSSQALNLSLSTAHGDAQAASLKFTDTSEDQLVKVQKTVVQTSGAVVSVGAVWWAARMSGLLASLMISTPAWRSLDPLPVMGLGEDRDAEDEFEGGDSSPDGERHMDEKAAGLFGARRPVRHTAENIG